IHIYFGVRTVNDIYKADVLAQITDQHRNVQVHIVTASGIKQDGLRTGLVTDAVAQDWQNLDGVRAYVCGAPPMVEAAALLLESKALPREHLYADAFYDSAT